LWRVRARCARWLRTYQYSSIVGLTTVKKESAITACVESVGRSLILKTSRLGARRSQEIPRSWCSREKQVQFLAPAERHLAACAAFSRGNSGGECGAPVPRPVARRFEFVDLNLEHTRQRQMHNLASWALRADTDSFSRPERARQVLCEKDAFLGRNRCWAESLARYCSEEKGVQ
jgi:hypothetical protein